MSSSYSESGESESEGDDSDVRHDSDDRSSRSPQGSSPQSVSQEVTVGVAMTEEAETSRDLPPEEDTGANKSTPVDLEQEQEFQPCSEDKAPSAGESSEGRDQRQRTKFPRTSAPCWACS